MGTRNGKGLMGSLEALKQKTNHEKKKKKSHVLTFNTHIDVMETDTTRISNTAGCYMSERKSMSNSHFAVVNQGASCILHA